MRWISDVWFRLRALLGRGTMERDLEDEFAFHIEMQTRKNIHAGMTPDEARRTALVELGGEDRFKEKARDSWGVGLFQDLGGDIRFSARQLLKKPAFSTLAALTLALGIGGTVALFSVVNGLMLRPLPIESENDVVVFWMDYNWRGVEFDFVRERVQVYESLAAFSNDGYTLRTEAGASLLTAGVTSSEFFDVLGAPPLLGRTFVPGDDRPGSEPVVVLSHHVWEQDFGNDPGIVGTRINLNGEQTTVVGVMPEGFYFPTPEDDIWVPLNLDPADSNYQGNGWLILMGRLRPGVTEARIQEDLTALTADLGERFDYPDAWDKTRDPYVTPVREYVLGDVGPVLLFLLGAVGMVLLMACANVAALILTRTADRTGEMSVRAALGAGRARLARQVLTESVLLGVVAGVTGMLLAVGLFDVLVASLPLRSGFGGTLTLDWTSLVSALGLSIVAGSLISLAPMRSLLRGDLSVAGFGERRSVGTASGGSRTQNALVVAEVLLAVVMATGAALLIRTVGELRSLDPGFVAEGVLTVGVQISQEETTADERGLFFDALLEEAAALPGVQSVGLINRLPLRDGGYQSTVALPDRPDLDGDRRPNSYYRPVTPETFATLGVEVIRGRGILPSDRWGTQQVAVINETFARTIWGNQDPIGRTISRNGFQAGDIEVVGVIRNVAIDDLVGDVPMAAYYAWDQTLRGSAYGILTLKTDLEPESLAPALRALLTRLDPRAAPGRMQSMETVLDNAMAEPLRLRFFLGLFSLLGIALGTVGVYGTVSYSVQRRHAEFGIRMALGAEPGRLMAEVVRTGMLPVVLGVIAGTGAALLASEAVARFLFEVQPTDPMSIAAAGAALLVAGIVAAFLPAWRASSTDPATALRSE